MSTIFQAFGILLGSENIHIKYCITSPWFCYLHANWKHEERGRKNIKQLQATKINNIFPLPQITTPEKQKKTNTKTILIKKKKIIIKTTKMKTTPTSKKIKNKRKKNNSKFPPPPPTHTLLKRHTRCSQVDFLSVKRPQFIWKIANKIQKYFFITFMIINGIFFLLRDKGDWSIILALIQEYI